MLLLELLKRTTEFFEKKGVPNARLDAELIIADVMRLKRLQLYLQFEKPVDDQTLDALRPLVKRRADREPLQYILGQTDWAGLKLKTDRRALIPRQETEELWEKIVEAYKDIAPPQNILDLGTGTGALALALKKSFPSATVTAVDASAEALALAKENATQNNLEVNFIQASWFDSPQLQKFDLVVSNPPYLTDAEWESAQPEVKLHEPRQALTAAAEGFADLEKIIREAKNFLTPHGQLWLETGIAHGPRIQALAAECGYLSADILPDLHSRPRFARLKV